MNKSTDYHDYVFRDGHLVGQFEETYQNSSTTPWHQDEQENLMDVRLTVELISDLDKFDEIHDFGWGMGHYLEIMSTGRLVADGKSFSYDISETACRKVASIF